VAVYLIHFAEPYRHAKHYLGYCDDTHHGTDLAVETRVDFHRRKRGSKLLKAVVEAGIDFKVVRVWPYAGRTFERKLKCQSSTPYCPECNPKTWMNRGLNNGNGRR